MEQADLGMTAQAFVENPSANRNNIFVEFYIHPRQNNAKTLEEGRPIFDDTEYVRKMTPGDKDNIIERPVRPTDKAEFPGQYAAIKNGQTDPVTSGTPLKMWPQVTRGMCEELAFFKIFTVEQLADVSDSNAQKFMGMVSLRQSARHFVEAAKGSAPLNQLRAEIEAKDAKIADLTDKLGDVLKRVKSLEDDE